MDLQVEDLGDGVVRLVLNGRLDTTGVDSVETRFNAAAVAGAKHAMVDMSGVEFVSSMGVRMLITAARAKAGRNGRLVLFGLQPIVHETLSMVALDQIVPIATDLDDARGRLTG